MWRCVAIITENMKFHRQRLSGIYLGPRSTHPEEATDVVDAGRARSEIVRSWRGADSRRRDPVQAVNLIL